MISGTKDILSREQLSKNEIVELLEADGDDVNALYMKSVEVKEKYIGNKVWFRGLIEFSNICGKDCLYCGIRKGNKNLIRYNLDDDEILAAARFAYENRYASVALQSGEIETEFFTSRIENLIWKIKEMSNGELGITISLGEQEPEVYKRWYDAGVHRYLLRMESANKELYEKIHPRNEKHNFNRRFECLKNIQDIGYQTGTGVMIGLPFQTLEDMAGDLLFMKEFNIDMCGMGPYIEHADTPLIIHKEKLLPLIKRFDLTLKMIAILRIMMKDINIVAATALQAIDPIGREKAIKIGANIVMPNITPGKYRSNYKLYDNKPCIDESQEECQSCLETRINLADSEIVYGEWGDSKHYSERRSKASGS